MGLGLQGRCLQVGGGASGIPSALRLGADGSEKIPLRRGANLGLNGLASLHRGFLSLDSPLVG